MTTSESRETVIRFENVDFGYTDEPVLVDVNLEIHSREMIGWADRLFRIEAGRLVETEPPAGHGDAVKGMG